MSEPKSEDAQTCFMDECYTPPQTISDTNTDQNMQSIMKNIYISCMNDNSDTVKVSKLIHFIAPYMQHHLPKLMKLKEALDPKDNDPCITSETFLKAMNEWALTIAEPSGTDTNFNIMLRKLESIDEDEAPTAQSTPKHTFEDIFLKTYSESSNFGSAISRTPIHNVSNSLSYNGEKENISADATAMQEQIKELEHQNRKLSEELQHIKLQLASSDEQNDLLHTEIKRLTCKLVSEQQINEELQKYRKDSEELWEVSVETRKTIAKLERLVTSSKKEIQQLQQNVQDLETEKAKLENTIEYTCKLEAESKALAIKLQAEVVVKEEEITMLEEISSQLKTKLLEEQQVVSHYTQVNESLKKDKEIMEKSLRETLRSQSLSAFSKTKSSVSSFNRSGISKPTTSNVSPTHNNTLFHTPLGRCYGKGYFNSPKLLAMLENPVSPTLNNSIYNNAKHTFMPGNTSINEKVMGTTSTPEPLPNIASLNKSWENLNNSRSYAMKQDRQLFSQHRFIGDDPPEDDTTKHRTIHCLCCQANTEVHTQRDTNKNIITATEEKSRSLPLTEGEIKEYALTTMSITGRASIRPRCKSTSSNNFNNSMNSDFEISGEDELFYKLQAMNVSPRESLEKELSQVNAKENIFPTCHNLSDANNKHPNIIRRLENKNAELENTIKRLNTDVDLLKSQIAINKAQKVQLAKSFIKLEQYSQLEEKYKALEDKVQTLETDNDQKYIKIVDLMEAKENLKMEFDEMKGNYNEQLGILKQHLLELENERNNLVQQLKKLEYEKENCTAVIKHLESVKNDCDVLGNRLQIATKAEEELRRKVNKIYCENSQLKLKCEMLNKMKLENVELKTKCQQLTEECSNLTKEINGRAEKEVSVMQEKINNELSRLTMENENLKGKLLKTNARCTELQQKIEAEVKDACNLKDLMMNQKSTIESLNLQLIDLNTAYAKLTQSNEEKKHQLLVLKDMINRQNQVVKSLETDKENITVKMYELKCENDKIIEKNSELVVQLEHKDQDNIYLNSQLESLSKSNQNIKVEYEIISCDYEKIKNSNTSILKEYQSMMQDNRLLVKANEHLIKDIDDIKGKINKMETEVLQLRQEKNILARKNNCITQTVEELNARLHSAKIEAVELLSKLQKGSQLNCQNTKCASAPKELRTANPHLNSENAKLQQEVCAVKSCYDCLASEKEIWLSEKNNWLQLHEELSKKLTLIMEESEHMQEQLNVVNDCREASVHVNEMYCTSCVVVAKTVEELNMKLQCAKTKISRLMENLSKNKDVKCDNKCVMQIVSELEDTNNMLQSKNQQLQTELATIKSKPATKKCKMQEPAKELHSTTTKLKTPQPKLDKSVGGDCLVLNEGAEKLDLSRKMARGKISTPAKPGNFDKLQIKIEKLRIKNESSEEHLISEKEKNKLLELENSTLQKDLSEILEHNAEERKSFLAEKSAIEVNLKIFKEDLHKLQQEKQGLEHEKSQLMQQIDVSKKKLQEVTRIKEERLRTANMANNQLKREIENLNSQKTELEKKSEKTQYLTKAKTQLERKLEAMNKMINECNVDFINKENCQLKDNIEVLTKQQLDFEKKLLKTEQNLKDRISSEKKLRSQLEAANTENSQLKQQLQELDYQKGDLEKKLGKSQLDLRNFEMQTLAVRESLTDLQSETDDNILKKLDFSQIGNYIKEKLKQVKSMQKDLKNSDNELTEFKIKLCNSSNCMYLLSEHINLINSTLTVGRQRLARSTFTAVGNCRPIFESVPDKQLILEEFDKGDSLCTTHIFIGPLDEEMLKFNHQIHLSSLFLDAIGQLRPVSVACEDAEIQVLSAQVPPSNNRSTNADIYETDQFKDNTASPKIPLKFTSRNNTVSTEVFTPFDPALPSLSNQILRTLGLSYEDDSSTWTKNEIEEKFSILVMHFAMDSRTIKNRLERQQSLQLSCQKKFYTEIKTLINALTTVKVDGENKRLINNCFQQVRLVVSEFSQTAKAAMALGALTQERSILKCVDLMTIHAENIKQLLQHTAQLFKCTSSPKTSETLKDTCHDTAEITIQSRERASTFEDGASPNKPKSTDLVSCRADESNIGNLTISRVLRESSQVNEVILSRIPRILYCVIGTIFCLIMCIVLLIPKLVPADGYPWRWVSWEDIFAPYIVRTYPYGPPPT